MHKQNIIKYISIAFFIGLIFVVGNALLDTGYHYSFLQNVIFLLAMTIVPGIGMFIGNVIRLKLMPDAIFTSNGITGLAKAKIFWSIGPQSIGWFIGLLAVGNFINGI